MLTKDTIVSKLKIDTLPPEKQDEIIQRLEEILQRKAALEIADLLKNQDVSETNTDSEMLSALKEKIPNLVFLVKDISVKTVDDFVKKLA